MNPSCSSRLSRLGALSLLALSACRPTPLNVGCGGGDLLSEVVVAGAALEGLSLWSAGVIAGGTDGDAVLVIDGIDGETLRLDTMVQGTMLGLTAGATVQIGDIDVPINIDGLTLTARELVTTYDGIHVGGDLVVGGEVRHLESAVGATMTIGTVSLGLGATPISAESLSLFLYDDPNGDVLDTGDLSNDCSGDGVCDPSCDVDDDCTFCPRDRTCDRSCDVDDDCACIDGDNTCTAGCGGLDSDCLPRDWTCAEERYGDGTCDDGCGAIDADDC